MTGDDHDLLMRAAKAAGLLPLPAGKELDLSIDGGLVFCGSGEYLEWNPLTDDGDALRLAVKLNLHISIECESAGEVTIEWDFDDGGSARGSSYERAPLGGDDYAATRRAIVRAAAALCPSNTK
ncbi:gp26 [Burkholderia phage BcepC6B]|uniref:Gp26 n=1 Tax=Burkholderia phage BcepC6B TaxID=2883949 RepID=Q6J1Q1_9CAUD|nr:hypothetical protein BcepC6B_gp26 [Burkholderia phage BcepC6B]AAT38385.1 gp26 [Burkholderia phage BcepC6B]